MQEIRMFYTIEMNKKSVEEKEKEREWGHMNYLYMSMSYDTSPPTEISFLSKG